MTSSLQSDLAWSQTWAVGAAPFPVPAHRCPCPGSPVRVADSELDLTGEREAHSQRGWGQGLRSCPSLVLGPPWHG